MAGIRPYLELTKPRITVLVAVTAAAAFVAAGAGSVAWGRLLALVAGTALAAGGTNALNQWWERDLDDRMRRTRSRPLPSGRLSPARALAFGSGLAGIGVILLWLTNPAVTAALAAVTVVLYVAVYTPLKRRTPACTYVGAVPGALPALGGWAAVDGTVSLAGWGMFGIVLLWQLPHFFALEWLARDDYGRAGFQTLSVRDPSGVRPARHAAACAAVLLPVSLLPAASPDLGVLYAGGALAGTLLFAAPAAAMVLEAPSPWARRLFRASLVYLPSILSLAVLDTII